MFFSQMHLSCCYRPLWVHHNTAISSCIQLTLQDKVDIIHTVERLVIQYLIFTFNYLLERLQPSYLNWMRIGLPSGRPLVETTADIL